MTLNELGYMPNDRLLSLNNESFTHLFLTYLEYYHTYKGKRYNENLSIKYVEVLRSKIKQNGSTGFNCNDVAYMFERELNAPGFARLSVEYIFNQLLIIDIEKTQAQKKSIINKTKEQGDPLWGQALRLRMYHDPNGKRLDKGEYKFNEVYDAVKSGYNFYSSEKLT